VAELDRRYQHAVAVVDRLKAAVLVVELAGPPAPSGPKHRCRAW
jgi:hypothetical protein